MKKVNESLIFLKEFGLMTKKIYLHLRPFLLTEAE